MSNPEDALRNLAAASASGQAPIELAETLKPVDAADALASSDRPESPLASRPVAPPMQERDISELSANALAQLSGAETEPYEPAARTTATRKRRMQKPDVGMIGLRMASIPVLCTVGLVMLALGVWGIMVKSGNNTLPMADQPNAQQLALLGLVALPIGILLFASAGFMLYMVSKDKAKLARWEAMQEED